MMLAYMDNERPRLPGLNKVVNDKYPFVNLNSRKRRGATVVSQAKITREEVKEAGSTFSAVLIEAHNAYMVLLSEGEDSLGTLAVSLPQKSGMIGPPLSSTLLGDRNITLARLLAERLAASLGKMVLVSVFVKSSNEREAGHIFLGLLDRILKRKES